MTVISAVRRKKEIAVKKKVLPQHYAPPRAIKVGRVATDTLGTIYTQKDATTLGFKKPR